MAAKHASTEGIADAANSAAPPESEQQFLALARASSDVIYRMSPDWREMRILTGGEFILDTLEPTETWLEKYIPAAEQPAVNAAISRAIGAKNVFELEHQVRRADGTIGWTFSRAVPILDAAGEVIEWFGAASDVTGRINAELAYSQQHRVYEAILTNTPDLAYVFDLQHRFIYANEGLLRMWGKTWDEAIGKTCLELGYEPWHAEMHNREIDQVAATRQSIRGEVPFAGTFGRRIYDYIMVPVFSEDGNVEAVAGTTRDVTDRKQAEEALRNHAEQFEALLNAAPIGAYLVDSDFIIREINPIAKPIFDAIAGGAIGRQLHEVLQELSSDRDADAVVEIFRHTLATGEPFVSTKWESRRSNLQTTQYYQWRVIRIMLPDGRFGLVCYFNDITEQVESIEEKQHLLESERAARSEAEHAGRMKDEFLATLSHELRTPLNAILGFATLMRISSLDEQEMQEAAETIERNARAQAQLIDDLLDMSRIVSGKLRLAIEPLDLPAVVDDSLKTVQPAAEAKGVRIQTIIEPLVGVIRGDAGRLQQIIWNLLSNAIKFTPKGGTVQVVVRQVVSNVEIRVIDNGQGIVEEFLPHVFDRFRQADASTTRKFGGLGLGLAITRHLVELHGGTIEVSSEGEGQGATFIVAFPVAIVSDPSLPRREAAPSAADAHFAIDDVDLHGVKVLVVDDELDSTRLVQRVLQECSADVETASSAQQAFDALEAQPFDVLISDIGMPEEDGYQLLRRLRGKSTESNRNIPSIALTAFARSEDRRRAALAGFQTHLSKPVDPGELVAVVASLAGRVGR